MKPNDIEQEGLVKLMHPYQDSDFTLIGVLTGRSKYDDGLRVEVQWSDGSVKWPVVGVLVRVR